MFLMRAAFRPSFFVRDDDVCAEPAQAFPSGSGQQSFPHSLYCMPQSGFFGVSSPNSEEQCAQAFPSGSGQRSFPHIPYCTL